MSTKKGPSLLEGTKVFLFISIYSRCWCDVPRIDWLIDHIRRLRLFSPQPFSKPCSTPPADKPLSYVYNKHLPLLILINCVWNFETPAPSWYVGAVVLRDARNRLTLIGHIRRLGGCTLKLICTEEEKTIWCSGPSKTNYVWCNP